MSTKRNPVGWFEIYVRDMNRAKAFYEGTLQIKLESLPTPDMGGDGGGLEMWMFPGAMEMEAPGCAGALCKMEGCAPGGGGTLIYFSCEDCAVEAGRVVANGGSVFREKFPIGEYGFVALACDTEGNTIGLHSMK
ncbi:MAG: VOC family protein [Akkermansiaceae bacterium]|nr:VOC family protein [Akkermansiaceae bacterium]